MTAAPRLHGHAGFRGADAASRSSGTATRSRRSTPARRKPAGRGMDLQPTPVEREARRLGIAGAHADDAEDARRRRPIFAAHDADAAVVVAYGLILPQADPRCAARSAASTCTPRCCRAGAARRRSTARSWRATPRPASWSCGWTRGSTPARWRWPSASPIGADMTAGELHDELARARRRPDGARARRRSSAARCRSRRRPSDGVTYAPKIDKAETRIDWSQAVARRAQPHPRAVAVSRRLVRARRRSALRECCARRAAKARARRARCSTMRSRSPAATARCASSTCSAPASAPMNADEFLRGTRLAAGAQAAA